MNPFTRQYTMQPPTKQATASRLMGRPGAVTGVATEVKKSTAPEAFFRKANFARTTLAQNSYVLGTNGGMSGFAGFFGFAGAERQVVPGISFKEDWTFADFVGDANWLKAINSNCGLDERYHGSLTYSPPSASTLTVAAGKWANLKALEADQPAVGSFIARVEAELRSAIAQADALVSTQHDSLCGKRTTSVETARIGYFNKIRSLLSEITAFTPQVVVQADGSTGGSATAKGAVTTSMSAADLMALQNATKRADEAAAKLQQDAVNKAAGGSGASSGGSPFSNPLVLGGVAVVGLGALYFVMKRKKG